ncbi:hypothetical protein LX32DRAFT_440423 [Colletotrichum zoysiae]|uniref:Uncharacterized protein n=1 Tax=Colletotrichum zoysiae TaxID=1216348 RepID=A0AAD9HE40_9PEZI|nr:hypothetical protein LX32DRAFT_440423 [Colletotrichum zoysiae]
MDDDDDSAMKVARQPLHQVPTSESSSSRHGLPCPSRIWRQDLAALCARALSSFAHNAKEPIGGRLAWVAPHGRQAAAGPSAGGQAAQYDPLGGTALAVDGQEAESRTNDPEFGTVRLTPTCAPRSRTPLATKYRCAAFRFLVWSLLPFQCLL